MVLKAQRECHHQWGLSLPPSGRAYVFCALCNAQFTPDPQVLSWKGSVPAKFSA